MNLRKNIELTALGIDEALQGVSSDPLGAAQASSMGLRVPGFVNSPTTRFLFLLAKRSLGTRQATRIVGWRELITIGINLAPSGYASVPLELEVTSPTFRFPDGNWSFHLVREPLQSYDGQAKRTDAKNWAYRTTGGPALLYETASFSGGTDVFGAPAYYMLNMTSYTPPDALSKLWEPIADLNNTHELRTFYRDARAWSALDVEVEGACNVCLYASVLQTNPATRPAPAIPSPVPPGTPREWEFVQGYTSADPANGPIIWRVGGGLMFEDLP